MHVPIDALERLPYLALFQIHQLVVGRVRSLVAGRGQLVLVLRLVLAVHLVLVVRLVLAVHLAGVARLVRMAAETVLVSVLVSDHVGRIADLRIERLAR